MAFENGISPAEFRRSRISDIRDIMMVKSAISEKEKRNKKVNDLMKNVRFK